MVISMVAIHSLYQNIAAATTESQLRSCLMDNISQHFGVQRWGLYLLDEDNNLASFDVVGVSDRFVARYDAVGKAIDPVLKYVLDYHAPAHEGMVFAPGQWKQSKLYRRCCAEYDHEHIMTGPIVGEGKLRGTIHFARIGYTPAFTSLELANLGAVCLHFSATLAKLRLSSEKNTQLLDKYLTPREVQIADLVAEGLTNADIARELWITSNTVKQALKRMFKKLNVSSRTTMVVKIIELSDR